MATELQKYPSQRGFQKGHKNFTLWGKGRKHTEESKIKIGLKSRGRRTNNGRHFSDKWKNNISKSKIGTIPWNKGLNPLKEQEMGRTTSPEYRKWRRNVFIRDNFTCKFCHRAGLYIEAHHIKTWVQHPELRFDINNGVTLCKDCHNLTKNKIIWIFGNSKSGKTTLAKKLLKIKYAIHLDGDMVREIWQDLKFSKEDRMENNLRVAKLADAIKKQKFDLVISTICPFRELRAKIKKLIHCKFIYITGGKLGGDYPFEVPREDEKFIKIEGNTKFEQEHSIGSGVRK